MITITIFHGMTISMFHRDKRQYEIPHIHVQYLDEEAIFSIPDIKILAGTLSKKKAPLIRAWIILHEQELMADWEIV